MKTTLFLLLILATAISGYYAGKNDTKTNKVNYFIDATEYGYNITAIDRNGLCGEWEEMSIEDVNQIINSKN